MENFLSKSINSIVPISQKILAVVCREGVQILIGFKVFLVDLVLSVPVLMHMRGDRIQKSHKSTILILNLKVDFNNSSMLGSNQRRSRMRIRSPADDFGSLGSRHVPKHRDR